MKYLCLYIGLTMDQPGDGTTIWKKPTLDNAFIDFLQILLIAGLLELALHNNVCEFSGQKLKL